MAIFEQPASQNRSRTGSEWQNWQQMPQKWGSKTRSPSIEGRRPEQVIIVQDGTTLKRIQTVYSWIFIWKSWFVCSPYPCWSSIKCVGRSAAEIVFKWSSVTTTEASICPNILHFRQKREPPETTDVYLCRLLCASAPGLNKKFKMPPKSPTQKSPAASDKQQLTFATGRRNAA